jgi:hypothetical protein
MADVSEELVVTSEPHPSEADVRTVREGLLAFNVEHVGRGPRSASVSLFLRDTQVRSSGVSSGDGGGGGFISISSGFKIRIERGEAGAVSCWPEAEALA